jgi:hypothetical protein
MLSNAPQSIVQGKAVFIFTKTVFHTTVIYENIKWKKKSEFRYKIQNCKKVSKSQKEIGLSLILPKN